MKSPRLHLLSFGVACSYLTLGVFDPSDAARLWFPYAVVMFVLMAALLWVEIAADE